MNERLKELACQIWPDPNISHTNHMRFAELIVKECVKEVKASHKYGNAMAKTVVKDAANHVKRHFGVNREN